MFCFVFVLPYLYIVVSGEVSSRDVHSVSRGEIGAPGKRRWSVEFLPDGETPGKPQKITRGEDGAFKLKLEGVKGSRLMCATRGDWSGGEALEFRVEAGAGMPGDIQVVVFLKDGDNCWYEATLVRKPVPGGRKSFSVPLDDGELWQNVGHGKPINGYSLRDVREFGIGLFCERPMSGEIIIDGLIVVDRVGDEEGPKVIEFREPGKSVGKYETYEVQFRLDQTFENPFDPEQVSVTAEITPSSGKGWTVFGFFTQDYRREAVDGLERLTAEGRPYWAVRIVPREEGKHTYRLVIKTPNHRTVLKPRNFAVSTSGRKGYVRVSRKDPKYWEFENGDFFYPVGHSVHASYDEHYHTMQKREKPVRDRRTLFYDEAFGKMGAAGETFTEIWMCPWWMELEWISDWHPYKGLGRYNLENAWCLDHIFRLAERYDIRLQIALMNHGELSYTSSDPDWETSPYFTQNGGFLKRPKEWFESERAQKLWRQKLRYIVARWGGSTNLFGWVVISESDLVGPYSTWTTRGGAGRRIYTRWCTDTAKYLQSIDPGGHPITNHYYGNYRHLDKELFRRPVMGYMASDAYREGRHLIDQFMGTVGLQHEMRKPIVVSEYGGDWCGATDNNLRAEQHGGIWAAYMIGMSSTPMFWWFEFVDEQELYGTYGAFSKFIKDEDLRGRPAETQRLKGQLSEDAGTPVNCLARVGRDWLDAWIFEERGLPYINYYESKEAFNAKEKVVEQEWVFRTISGASVTFKGLRPGQYTAEYWNTVTGEVVRKTAVTAGPDKRLVLKPPTFTRDIAVKVRRAP